MVGAPYENGIGAVYTFQRTSPSAYTAREKLNPSTAGPLDRFGAAVDIYLGTMIVGAPGDEMLAPENAGAVYFYEMVVHLAPQPPTWEVTQKSVPLFFAQTGDEFGAAVAMDGLRAIVGRPGAEYGIANGEGDAFVYKASVTPTSISWAEQSTLFAPDWGAHGANHDFGAAVAIDGTSVAVGAPGDDDRRDPRGRRVPLRARLLVAVRLLRVRPRLRLPQRPPHLRLPRTDDRERRTHHDRECDPAPTS